MKTKIWLNALLCAAAMTSGAAALAQPRAIETNATFKLAQSSAPGTALSKLLEAANNQDFVCGTRVGWDASCLRTHYTAPLAKWPQPWIDPGKAWKEFAPVPEAAPPATPAEGAQRALGAALFFDPGLSRKGAVSCASCHHIDKSFGDGLALSVGEDKLMGRRRAQTLFAAPFAKHLFWDGRASSLAAQAKDSIQNNFEMNNTLEAALGHVNAQAHYQPLMEAAFGQAPISEDQMAQAIASFVSTLRPPKAPIDDVIAGNTGILTDQQLLGMHLFRTKARCMNCHSGALLSDMEFHDLGLSFYGRRNQDLGRFEHTRDKADLGKFRTPSLRGVSYAGPWMHNGLFASMPGLIRLYNAGMGVVAGDPEQDSYIPPKSPHIRELQLNAEEVDALVEWIKLL